jgi:hypothetical protein
MIDAMQQKFERETLKNASEMEALRSQNLLLKTNAANPGTTELEVLRKKNAALELKVSDMKQAIELVQRTAKTERKNARDENMRMREEHNRMIIKFREVEASCESRVKQVKKDVADEHARMTKELETSAKKMSELAGKLKSSQENCKKAQMESKVLQKEVLVTFRSHRTLSSFIILIVTCVNLIPYSNSFYCLKTGQASKDIEKNNIEKFSKLCSEVNIKLHRHNS